MRFHKHSPYLCEAFHVIVTSPPPQADSLDLGSFMYQELFRRLVHGGVKPFTVIPWCFTDPRNCEPDNSFPDPFADDPEQWRYRPWVRENGEVVRNVHGAIEPDGKTELEKRIGQIFSIHLHNQWDKTFPEGGWVSRLLESYDRRLEETKVWDLLD